MALGRRYVLDGTVTMLMVVPGNKLINPAARCFETLERLARVSGRVLQRPEQTLGVRVIITHRRTAERRDNTETLQGGQHGCTLHRASVIRVQYQLAPANAFCQTGFVDQVAGMIRRFFRVDFPADDLATEDVLNHVQAIELPPDAAGQEGNIPAPGLRCFSRQLALISPFKRRLSLALSFPDSTLLSQRAHSF